jgi:hypothetical protein
MHQTEEEYNIDLVDLCMFMANQINTRPENIENEAVHWPRVIADVYLMYTGPFDDNLLTDAILLINKVSGNVLVSEFIIPEGTTIH